MSKARVVVCDGKFFAATSTRSPDGRAAILKLSQRALLKGFPREKSYQSKQSNSARRETLTRVLTSRLKRDGANGSINGVVVYL
jgi:hypothetical protein